MRVPKTMKAASSMTEATTSALTEINVLAIRITRTAVHGRPAANPTRSVPVRFFSASSAIPMTNATQLIAAMLNPMNIGIKVLANSKPPLVVV